MKLEVSKKFLNDRGIEFNSSAFALFTYLYPKATVIMMQLACGKIEGNIVAVLTKN